MAHGYFFGTCVKMSPASQDHLEEYQNLVAKDDLLSLGGQEGREALIQWMAISTLSTTGASKL